MLDGLEDPHNLGAILRTCDAVGVDGVIIGKNRSVGLNGTVAKVSTGAIHHVKVAQVTNLTRTLEDLKKKNIKMDDGLFEALLIKSLKNPIELQQVLNALLSKQLDAENMCYLSSSFIHIISDDDIQWTLDGEDGGCCKDAYMQNMKEALSIICDRRALAKVSSKRAIE